MLGKKSEETTVLSIVINFTLMSIILVLLLFLERFSHIHHHACTCAETERKSRFRESNRKLLSHPAPPAKVGI